MIGPRAEGQCGSSRAVYMFSVGLCFFPTRGAVDRRAIGPSGRYSPPPGLCGVGRSADDNDLASSLRAFSLPALYYPPYPLSSIGVSPAPK